MATSKKEPVSASRDRAATRMSPNLRPSSSDSSGYGARRARSVPSSPDRKFGSPSVTAPSGSSSSNVNRPSLSSAGRSVSSRAMSTSSGGSSVPAGSSRAQPLFPGSKPMLARAKSDKVTNASQKPPAALSVPPPISSSFKASPSSSLRNKLSPRPSCTDGSKAPTTASAKPSGGQRMSAARGGRAQPASNNTCSPGAAAKKRLDGGNVRSSKAKGVSHSKAVPASATTRMETEEEGSMKVMETDRLSTTVGEELLHEHLPDPVDVVTSTDIAEPDQYQPSSNQPEDGEDKGHLEDAAGNELHNGGQDADNIDQSGCTEEEANGTMDKSLPLLNTTEEVAQVWKKDDPKGNDALEEAKRKLLEERKSRVKALVGAFETVMSFKE